MRKNIVFYLNGNRKEESADKARMMLAEYLRYDQNLTGTKIVCAEGDCGACSVLRYFPQNIGGVDTDQYLPINSCITLLAQLDGSSLVTVEALKDHQELSEPQKAMVECHGSQCGFCTPGFVMALTGLLEEKKAKKETTISSQEAKNCMTGNLCRCTGYQPIINASLKMDVTKGKSIKERFFTALQDKTLKEAYAEPLLLESPDFVFYAPKTLKEASEFLLKRPHARIVAAATDLGVGHNKRKTQLTELLSLHLIAELYSVEQKNGYLTAGARVTHTEFRHAIKGVVPEFAEYLDIFASPQIKNIGTVVGNIANASPIGDTPPAFLALDAELLIFGPKGQREEELSKFYVAYRTTTLSPGEIITGIRFKLPEKNSSIRLSKTSIRKDLDISAVNLAIKVDWADAQKKEIKDIIIAAGGVAATPLRLLKTENLLKSKTLSATTIDEAVSELHREFNPISDVRASSAYRHVLMENLFRRFFSEVARGEA